MPHMCAYKLFGLYAAILFVLRSGFKTSDRGQLDPWPRWVHDW